MKNQVQLIAYVDRLSGAGFAELNHLLNGLLAGVFGGVHLLPFFTPFDGADAGFDPIDHAQVDARLGTWKDVQALSSTADIVADLIVNHASSSFPQFLDFSKKGPSSEYAGMFLTYDRVFPRGAREAAIEETVERPAGLDRHAAKRGSGRRRLVLMLMMRSYRFSPFPQGNVASRLAARASGF